MDAILVIHLVAVGVLAATNLGALVTTVLARRATGPARVARLLAIHNLLAAKTLVPAAGATLLSGAWLTYRTGASLVAPWMLGTLVLFVASALIGILYLLPEEALASAEARRQVAAVDLAWRRGRTSPAVSSRSRAGRSCPTWSRRRR